MNGALYLSLNSELLPTEQTLRSRFYFHSSDLQGRGRERGRRGGGSKREFMFGALFCNRV